MLSHLTIRDFAIVESLEIELGPGMTVLTGETGAGKSILLDALGLALGGRATASLVRTGAARAEVVASFDVAPDSDAAAFLAGHELEADEGECIVRRTVTAEGRSRAFVNARPVPAQALRSLGEVLVDIHGQHAHQSLGRAGGQREMLDSYAANEALLERTAGLHARWLSLEDERIRLGRSSEDREAREDYLRYQIAELHEHVESPEALAALADEHRRLAHADGLLLLAARTLERLAADDGGSVGEGLRAALRDLEDARQDDRGLDPVFELVEGAAIQVEEAAGELRRYHDGLEVSPERLAALESRLEALEGLARKHRTRPEGLGDILAGLEGELAESERSAERLQAVEQELGELVAAYREADGELGARRRAAGARLAAGVEEKLALLGMTGARLAVEVEDGEDELPRPHGGQRVRLMVSANPGEAPRPLAQVASGGELSRIGLAVQVVGNGERGVPTMIFDEVDAGVGGRIAEMVGRELHALGAGRQVLTVTHLPQVASQAHQHLEVSKRSAGGRTWTSVQPLDEEARVMEVARMLGGERITDQTVAHAREMLAGR